MLVRKMVFITRKIQREELDLRIPCLHRSFLRVLCPIKIMFGFIIAIYVIRRLKSLNQGFLLFPKGWSLSLFIVIIVNLQYTNVILFQ